MKILIVAATKSEIISNIILSHNILITGVGMINTAINLTKELMRNRYDLVINMGIAGSFNKELKNGFVVEVIEDNFSENPELGLLISGKRKIVSWMLRSWAQEFDMYL